MKVHAVALEEMNFEGGDYEKIPQHMRDAIMDYALHRRKPGDFLTAVLCNDLRGAVCYADAVNLPLIKTYVLWFYNRCPAFLVGRDNFIRHLAGEQD